MSDVTRILSAIENGDAHAAEQLFPLVYEELRRIAAFEEVMDKVLVVVMGLEGGSISVYGRQKEGIWSFWREHCFMVGLDKDLNDVWEGSASEPVRDVALAVPDEWPLYYPGEIHPAFLDWFRNNYDKACSRLVETHQNYQWQSKHGQWMRLLYGKP
jgi:hypothetical protein